MQTEKGEENKGSEAEGERKISLTECSFFVLKKDRRAGDSMPAGWNSR